MIWDGEDLPAIKADKVEQHIHTFPPESALIWRGFRSGFGVSIGVGFAVGLGKLLNLIIGLVS